jgi:PiT family inorganic phosphate transporter
MVTAWAMTFPLAALMGALVWWIGDLFGGAAGAVLVFVILCVSSYWMFRRSRLTHVGAHNVNDAWEGPKGPPATPHQHSPEQPPADTKTPR